MSDTREIKPNMTQALSPEVNSLLGEMNILAPEQMYILELFAEREATVRRASSYTAVYEELSCVWYYLHNNYMG